MSEPTAEEMRLRDPAWRCWGPYLAERQWGTVREDYSADGNFWDYFSHDDARSRAYRWAEDGIGGLSDEDQLLCFSVALWNGAGPILKERLFGVTGPEGNHGEDVKEQYFYLDAVPSHAYLKMLYKYPQRGFPYSQLVSENRKRGFADPEFEVGETEAFAEDRYFDVVVEYAKSAPDDVTMRVTVTNRGPETAPLHVLQQCWYRNTWSWTADAARPALHLEDGRLRVDHPQLSALHIYKEESAQWLLTENDTHMSRVFHTVPKQGFYKDAFHDYVVDGRREAVRQSGPGTKAAAYNVREIGSGETVSFLMRMSPDTLDSPFDSAGELFQTRIAEADAFYASVAPETMKGERQLIHRQANAGMIWNKQFYHFDVYTWMRGDHDSPLPKGSRADRLRGWEHLNTGEILSMPDT